MLHTSPHQQQWGAQKEKDAEWPAYGSLEGRWGHLPKYIPPDSSWFLCRPGVRLNSSLIEWLFTGQCEMPALLRCGSEKEGGPLAFVWPTVWERGSIVLEVRWPAPQTLSRSCFVSSSVTISFIQVRTGSWKGGYMLGLMSLPQMVAFLPSEKKIGMIDTLIKTFEFDL